MLLATGPFSKSSSIKDIIHLTTKVKVGEDTVHTLLLLVGRIIFLFRLSNKRLPDTLVVPMTLF